TAEHTIKSSVQTIPVRHYIATVIRLICHHDDRSITSHCIESANYGTPKAMLTGILHRSEIRDAHCGCLKACPCVIGAAVVYHYDLMGNAAKPKLQMQMLDGRFNASSFIPRRNYHGQQLKRLRSGHPSDSVSHSGCSCAWLASSEKIRSREYETFQPQR